MQKKSFLFRYFLDVTHFFFFFASSIYNCRFFMTDIASLLSRLCCRCYSFRNEKIAHHDFADPTTSYIRSGIDALNVSQTSPLIIADFGSSYGRTSIEIMKKLIEYLRKTKHFLPTPLIIHNDLPTNDWTKFLQYLTVENSYESAINSRSFYEQCLPVNSLAIGFSSASLHYLSVKACNIVNHCYIHFAEENERRIFANQSKLDFDSFIQSRSRELRTGGILILNIPSVDDKQAMSFNSYFDLLYQCARNVQRLTCEELEEFTLPFYLRSFSECVDLQLFHRCSLKIVRAEFVRLKSFLFGQYQKGQITPDFFAQSLTMLMRPGIEATFKQALQINERRSSEEIEEISKIFWSLFEEKVKHERDKTDLCTYATYLILKKI